MNPILGLATSWSSITEIVERCKKLKVNAVALRVASLPKNKNTAFISKQSLIEIQGKLSDAGIKINTLIQWFGDEDRLVKTPSKNNHAIESMLETIRIQGETGINCQLHYVDVPEPSQPSLDGMYWDGMLSIYKKIIPQAEMSKVNIANHGIWRCLPNNLRERAIIENVKKSDYRSYRKPTWGGPYLVRTADHINRIVSSVPSIRNGYTLCTGLYITGGDPLSELRRFNKKIFFVQIRDLKGRWPNSEEVFPGTGDLNFSAILSELKNIGYDGFIHPEHLGEPLNAKDDIEARATYLLREWIDQA